MTKNNFEYDFRTQSAGFSSHHHAVIKFEISIAYLHSVCSYKLSYDLFIHCYQAFATSTTKEKKKKTVTIRAFLYNLFNFNCLNLEQNLSLQTLENYTLTAKNTKKIIKRKVTDTMA